MIGGPTPDARQLDSVEELKRRAREWVNRTVPMLPADVEEECSPVASANAICRDTIWDSDEEGVETRMRVEAKPEAGAGGANETTPFYMQVMKERMGKI